MQNSENYSQFPRYTALVEASRMHSRIEGISESGDYEIEDFSKEAIKVGVEELGFAEIIQAKLYLCAKLELSPQEAMEMVDKVNESNIEKIATQTHDQLI